MKPNRHVVITGASSGIGEALAREYAKEGAQLTLVARRRDRLEALAQSLPQSAQIIVRDLEDPAVATDWLPEAEATYGPVNVLINNAGVQRIARSSQIDIPSAEALLHLNLTLPLRLISTVLPGMINRGDGTLINISSLAAFAPVAGMMYYNASKSGFASASEALRGELKGTGVKVLTVYPGAIATDMLQEGKKQYGYSPFIEYSPTGTPSQLATRIRNAEHKGKARVLFPHYVYLARWFPGVTRLFLDRATPKLTQELGRGGP